MTKQDEALPTHEESLWDGPEVKVHTPKKITCDEHAFAQTSGIEVTCKRCGVGFQLTPGMYVQDEHIYSAGELVI